MTWVDIQLALVGAVAMLEPATLVSSVLALVLSDRPLRTGSWFYLGGLGATLAVGVAGAFVIGNAAASHASSPRTWVAVFNLVAGALLVAYVARAARRPADPEKTASNIERMRKLTKASAPTIVAAGAVLANAGVFMVIALKDISQLNPSVGQYIADWVLFALVSMLPLGLALALLRVAPTRTMSMLVLVRGGIERRARTTTLVILVALAASLLREGVAGLTS